MTNRRQVLQLGITASAASLIPVSILAASPSPESRLPVYRILHDTRFPDSLAQARVMQTTFRLHTPALQPLAGDITRFWHQDLSRQWQQAPEAIAGVTGEDILFCLAQLAREHRMRVRWRQIMPANSTDRETLVAWIIAKV